MKLELEVYTTRVNPPEREGRIHNVLAYEIGKKHWTAVSVDHVNSLPMCYPYWGNFPEPKEPEFITDWRNLEVGILYWMIDRADATERDIIEIVVRNTKDETIYTCIAMNDPELIRFRENTHVFYPVAEAPRLPKDLLYFEG
jgi:uncharacterized protein YebE (UPF0316 family)